MPPDKVWPAANRKQKPLTFVAGFAMSLLSCLLIGRLDSLFVGTRPGAMVDCTALVVLPMTIAAAWCLADIWRGIQGRSRVSIILAILGLLLNLNAFWAIFVKLK